MSSQRIPPAVERKLASGAHQSERAIVVGNRGGVIEWANDAWTRVTGYALDESISKPVSDFLSGVEIDRGVVDFVSGCFEQGRVCDVELYLRPPLRRELWIQLRVEPLFDAGGEVSDFIASATDITGRKREERLASLDEVDLSAVAARALHAQLPFPADTVLLDAVLERGLPLVLADAAGIESLLARLVSRANEAIGSAWGTVTVWTGILGEGEGPLHRRDLLSDLPRGHWAFLEVHDTGGQPGGTGHERVTEPFLCTGGAGPAVRVADARSRLAAQGAQLRIDSDYVDGTSVVMLFPFACDDSLELEPARRDAP